MSPNWEALNDIAAELAIDPAFVEKDWYSVQILKRVSTIINESITTIFSGGTSLSKGYSLIERFSEDLDFRAQYNFTEQTKRNRSTRRHFRDEMIANVQSITGIRKSKEDIGSNYFKLLIEYDRRSELHSALRPELQIEVSFTQPRLTPALQPIQSMISQFSNQDIDTKILCLSPIETGADKLSALTWRVLNRNRQSDKDDPTLIRHLHDLCALQPVLEQHRETLQEITSAAFSEDQQKQTRSTGQAMLPSFRTALTTLREDKEYSFEYDRFVKSMSYADDKNVIHFEMALASFEDIINYFDG